MQRINIPRKCDKYNLQEKINKNKVLNSNYSRKNLTIPAKFNQSIDKNYRKNKTSEQLFKKLAKKLTKIPEKKMKKFYQFQKNSKNTLRKKSTKKELKKIQGKKSKTFRENTKKKYWKN